MERKEYQGRFGECDTDEGPLAWERWVFVVTLVWACLGTLIDGMLGAIPSCKQTKMHKDVLYVGPKQKNLKGSIELWPTNVRGVGTGVFEIIG